jgi:benzoylformate decarboxylase
MDLPCAEEVYPTTIPSTRVAPDDEFVQRAAGLLARARKPMLFVGDGVAYSAAREEAEQVAEVLGAEIWGVDSGEVNVSYAHPLYQGQTGHMFGASSFPVTSKGDVNLVCGTYMVPEVFPRLGSIYAPGATVIHIDLDGGQIAKNHAEELGVVADPKCSLARLLQALRERMTPQQRQAAQARAAELGAAKSRKLAEQLEHDRAVREEVPMHASRFMEELAALAPRDLCVFDEALTCSPELTRYLPPAVPGQFLQTRGGSLGVGIPGAIALKLAHPEKTVFGFTGDGGSMYTIQALWTAAHHRIGAKFVVCNNQSYMLLKLNILQYWKDQIHVEEHAFPESFSLANPAVDFVRLGESMGVPGSRVEKPGEIRPAIEKALAHDGPFLIDLVLTDRVPGAKMSGHCKCGQ